MTLTTLPYTPHWCGERVFERERNCFSTKKSSQQSYNEWRNKKIRVRCETWLLHVFCEVYHQDHRPKLVVASGALDLSQKRRRRGDRHTIDLIPSSSDPPQEVVGRRGGCITWPHQHRSRPHRASPSLAHHATASKHRASTREKRYIQRNGIGDRESDLLNILEVPRIGTLHIRWCGF